MEAINKIELFLSGKSTYADGVELYKQHGSNNTLKALFADGEDDYSRKKLKTELKVLHVALAVKKSNDFVSFSPSKKKASINVEALPDHLKTEYYKLSPIIREIAATNPTLIHLKTVEARHASAKRIVELVEKRRAILTRLDYFQEKGEDHPFYVSLPEPEPAKVSSSISYFEAQYELKLARSLRSKLKKKPTRLNDLKVVCDKIKDLEKIVANGK